MDIYIFGTPLQAGVTHNWTLRFYYDLHPTITNTPVTFYVNMSCPLNPTISETAVPATMSFSHYYTSAPFVGVVQGGSATTP